MSIPRIIITPGEPAGIGPDIVLQIAQETWPAELIVVCDPDLLSERANQLHLPMHLADIDFSHPAQIHKPGTLKIIPLKLKTPCMAGHLNLDNAHYVINSLERAVNYCLQHHAHALVTPVTKPYSMMLVFVLAVIRNF